MEGLIRTIEKWDYSSVHERCLVHDGCIVDVGCLKWDWSKYFIGKKRVIGVDPFEKEIPNTELYKGMLGSKKGSVKLKYNKLKTSIFGNNKGGVMVPVITYEEFCLKYKIKKISVLKINIEGGEYDLLPSISDKRYAEIDQIAISFHDRKNPKWEPLTKKCIRLLESKGFKVIETNKQWGWYLAVKEYA